MFDSVGEEFMDAPVPSWFSSSFGDEVTHQGRNACTTWLSRVSPLHLDTNTKLAGKVKTDSEVHNNLKKKYSDGINTQRSVKAGHCCFHSGDKTEERGIVKYSELMK